MGSLFYCRDIRRNVEAILIHNTKIDFLLFTNSMLAASQCVNTIFKIYYGMKKRLLILLVVIAMLCIGVVISRQHAVVMVPPVSLNGTYCYERTQEATDTAPYRVEEHMMLTIAGDKVTGTKSGTQQGPDMTNGYVGTLTYDYDGELEVMYAYVVEGAANREVELYTVVGKNLLKHRYVLRFAVRDGQSVLVPDMATTQTIIAYTGEPCR